MCQINVQALEVLKFQALEGLKFQNKQTPKQTNRTEDFKDLLAFSVDEFGFGKNQNKP